MSSGMTIERSFGGDDVGAHFLSRLEVVFRNQAMGKRGKEGKEGFMITTEGQR